MNASLRFFYNRSGWFWFGFAFLSGLCLFLLLVGYIFYINRSVQIEIPRRSLPPNNSYDDVVRILQRLTVIKPAGPMSDARPVSDWSLSELKEFSDAHASELDALEAALKDRPFVHPRKPGGETLPHYATARECARRIAGDIYFHVQSGNYEMASRRMALGYEYSVRFMDGGRSITMLVASAIGGVALEEFCEIVSHLDEDNLRLLAEELARIEGLRVPASDIFTEEKIDSRYYFQLLWSEPGIIPGPLRLNAIGFVDSRYILPYILQDKRRTFQIQEAYFDQFIQKATGPYKTIQAEPNLLVKLISNEPQVENNIFLIYCNDVARHNLMTAEIALRRYWLANKRYPASLKELTPKYLSEVPTDPMNDGKPLTYRQLDGGKDFLLYSYGANCKDEGGKDGNYRNPDSAADMVAGKWSKQ